MSYPAYCNLHTASQRANDHVANFIDAEILRAAAIDCCNQIPSGDLPAVFRWNMGKSGHQNMSPRSASGNTQKDLAPELPLMQPRTRIARSHSSCSSGEVRRDVIVKLHSKFTPKKADGGNGISELSATDLVHHETHARMCWRTFWAQRARQRSSC